VHEAVKRLPLVFFEHDIAGQLWRLTSQDGQELNC
jgi:hypothetical protein